MLATYEAMDLAELGETRDRLWAAFRNPRTANAADVLRWYQIATNVFYRKLGLPSAAWAGGGAA